MYTKLIGALLISTMLFSCNKNSAKEISTEDITLSHPTQPAQNQADKKQIPVASEDTTVTGSIKRGINSKSSTTNPNSDWSKKIIKTADVKIEVKNFKNYSSLLNNKVRQYGAYIAKEENNFTDEKTESIISVKVPVQLFDDLLNDLTTTDDKLLGKSINANDVTGDIVDTRSRLEAKKEMRLKYLDFLKQSKNMTEVLQVQDEINNIQEEIESASGRFASLTSQAAYSTVNITFFQPSVGHDPADAQPGFGSQILSSFKEGASWLSGLLLALVSVWPFLTAVIIGLFIYKKNRPAKLIKTKCIT